ncbi:hypothetical protein HNQ91_005372 [Filimonas zeae]|nr:hypothetical protein [Filimonas zeae]
MFCSVQWSRQFIERMFCSIQRSRTSTHLYVVKNPTVKKLLLTYLSYNQSDKHKAPFGA